MSEKSTERPTDLTYLGKKAEKLRYLLAYHKTPTTKADLFMFIALAKDLIYAVDWTSIEDQDENAGGDAYDKVCEMERAMHVKAHRVRPV